MKFDMRRGNSSPTFANEVSKLIAQQEFMDALPGYLLPDAANQARLGALLKTLQSLARLAG